GLTFSRVIIDLGRGAFASGQSYVALSRSTSLDGLTLKSPLTARDIFVNPAIVGFTRLFNNQDAINQAIEAARADEMYRQAAKEFDMGHTSQAVDLFFAAMQRKDILHRPEVIRLIKHKLAVVDSLRAEIKTLKSEAGEGATKFRQLAGEYITLGEECLEEGELSPAIANYRKALDIAPGDLRALHGLANAYTLSADLDSAVSTYLTILKQDSENVTALIRLSDLYQQTGDTYEALNLLLKALAHDKKNPAIYNSIADIYDLLGDPDEAERYRHAAKTLRPPRRKKG
ncbi:MAG: tetratricopeptide repeat protein, partial [Muribaculaceae bacterium]|nr:tetratricopeptide repeat protein [Muribaculaceae bacterium]